MIPSARAVVAPCHRRDAQRLLQPPAVATGCHADGHFGKVFWGGAFAMKSALRKTTDAALRQCFERFLADARAGHPSWAIGTAPVDGASVAPDATATDLAPLADTAR